MAHLIPPSVYKEKLAALQAAEATGRAMAQDAMTVAFAEHAGVLFAKEAGVLNALSLGARAGGRALKKGFNMGMRTPAKAATSIPAGTVSRAAAAAAPASGKLVPAATQAASKAAPVATGSAKKSMTMGRAALKAAPWAIGGGLAYGAYKGIPAAARVLEQSRATPWAHGSGWSATPYGYGHNPYGGGAGGGSMGLR